MTNALRRILHGQASDPAGKGQSFLELTAVVWREDDQWVSSCAELDIASSGDTAEVAFDELVDAIEAYLNTLEELGERDAVLTRRGVPVYQLAPADYHPSIDRGLLRHKGAHFRPIELPVRGLTALSA